MSSSLGGVVSSSPQTIRGSSPVRRRSVSSDISDHRAPRHSPTLARSFDPNDPQAMERQRTMDVDMAMHLSLARREPSYSPVAPFASPGVVTTSSPFDASQVSANDPLIQAEIDNVVLEDHGPLSMGHADYRFEHQDDVPRIHHPHPIDPVVVSGAPIHEEPSFGLPSYQPNVSQLNFDFSPMEDFATAEKVKLGLNSALTPKFVLGPTRRPRPSASQPVPIPPLVDGIQPDGAPNSQADSSAPEPSSPKALRLRKLSQSNPQPRPHRRGIGGKMALFEGGGQDLPFSLPPRLGGQGGAPANASYDNLVGPSVTGILNTGHDRPYRFSFYSNALSATIHARSLSELPAEGQTFEQLFSGIYLQPKESDPRATSPVPSNRMSAPSGHDPVNGFVNNPNHQSSNKRGGEPDGPNRLNGDVNTWWLDVLSPTDEEMKMLSKVRPSVLKFEIFIHFCVRQVFSIHPLTTEDILMEETREKIELFRNYYLVCFRSFDQDPYSPTHLEPLNMYIIVFREGILSFHFRPTPHSQNVRRRIKQLRDYISVTSDWISYALIDDITDAFGPLIQGIEYEVDSIDELVLILKDAEQSDMLRRIGTCRKKVMGLLRLMGNKADVVKGLAKRCNENWRVAPTSDIVRSPFFPAFLTSEHPF